MNNHTVFVIDKDDKPLTPTTPSRARKLIRDGVAKKTWNKFNQFGIKLIVEVGDKTPDTVLGIDVGTKFEGYSVIVDKENTLNVKLDLPNKKNLSKKLIERSYLRRTRRCRLRKREIRSNNRKRNYFLAPSQLQVINSRLKIINEIKSTYPVNLVALEDVTFNHYKKKWGSNFSTCEIGKNLLRKEISKFAKLYEYKGYETKQLRDKYGYIKTKNKSENVFTSHCSDSLSIAVDVILGKRIEPNKELIVVDDTYRCIRRMLHKMNLSKGGVLKNRSTGNVDKLRKGLIVGTDKGEGMLVGKGHNRLTILSNITNTRISIPKSKLTFVSTKFRTRKTGDLSSYNQ